MSVHSEMPGAPKEDVFPGGQSTQAVSSIPPVWLPYVPGRHLKLQEVLPGIGLNEPVSQGSHVAPESLPSR